MSGIRWISTVLLATEGVAEETVKGEAYSRLFGLDLQLLVDAVIPAISIFVLFVILSKMLFNPVRELLEKRQAKITEDLEAAEQAKEDTIQVKEEYEGKLRDVQKEAESILSESRKKALAQEKEIIEDAKEEAQRIRVRADKEIALEKNKVKDEVKQEMIAVATAMAGKIIETSISEQQQSDLIEETLKEMGDSTWQN